MAGGRGAARLIQDGPNVMREPNGRNILHAFDMHRDIARLAGDFDMYRRLAVGPSEQSPALIDGNDVGIGTCKTRLVR